MSNNEFLLLIVLMTISTVLVRGFFFLFAHSVRMPDWLQHALGFVPAVALASILAPDLLLSGGVLVEPWTNIRLLAGIAAVLFFLKTRHLLGTLVFGMACFTLLRLFIQFV
jgi:branched-subunit amino acid transport protein